MLLLVAAFGASMTVIGLYLAVETLLDSFTGR